MSRKLLATSVSVCFLQKLVKKPKKQFIRQNFSKFSESVRTHPNASEPIQMHPNASERIRMHPNRSVQVRASPKTSKNGGTAGRPHCGSGSYINRRKKRPCEERPSCPPEDTSKNRRKTNAPARNAPAVHPSLRALGPGPDFLQYRRVEDNTK